MHGLWSEYSVLFLILWSLINFYKVKLYDLRVSRADLKTLFEKAKTEKELLKQKLRVSEHNEKLKKRIDTIAEEQTHVQKEVHRLSVKESVSDENVLQLQQELLAVTDITDKC